MLYQAPAPAPIFGSVQNPFQAFGSPYGGLGEAQGPIYFISNIVKFITIAVGVFAFVNLVLSGAQYIGSSGNPEVTEAAWKRIYMSLIGLVIVVAAVSITAIVSKILFGDASAILSPTIFGPGQ